jgi:hypothetical protein
MDSRNHMLTDKGEAVILGAATKALAADVLRSPRLPVSS